SGACDLVGRAHAHGNAEAPRRRWCGRRCHRDDGCRSAAGDRRRRHLCRDLCRDDRGRAHAIPEGRCHAAARGAGGCRHRGCAAPCDAAAAVEQRGEVPGFHGPSLVAARRHGRGARKAAALSAGRGGLPRQAVARLGARAKRCGSGAVDGARAIAAALHAAEIPAEGGGLHFARRRRGTFARPCADARRRCLARCGFSAGARSTRFPRRSGRGPAHPRSQTVNIAAGFANISLLQLLLVAIVALFASLVGGLAGYGTGALMPLVLVPMVGAEPVVPIIAISAIFANLSRSTAYFRHVDGRRALIVIVCAAVTTALGAYGYTKLTNAGAALVIGTMLILSVPLRRLLRRRAVRIGDGGLAAGAIGYGVVVGGTSGSGVILLSLLMAAGLEGAAVIATDAVISVGTSIIKISVFGLAGVVTAQVFAFALLIGAIGVPGAFLARAFVERMPVHIHAAILDAAVIAGGLMMISAAARQLF